MGKIKPASLFFGMAILLALTWVGVEVLIYSPLKSESAKECKFTDLRNLPEQQLLALMGKSLWTFDPAKELLFSYQVNLDHGWRGEPASEGFPLRCRVPGYHCFLSTEQGGFEKLTPFTYQNDVVLIHAEKAKRSAIYPALLKKNKLSLSSPLQMCGKLLKPSGDAYFITHDQIAYYDSATAMLAVWLLEGFTGAVTRSKAREPNHLYRIRPGVGLEISNCDSFKDGVVSSVQFLDGKTLVLNDSPQGTEARMYSSLSPLVASEVSPLLAKGVHFLNKNLSLVKIVPFTKESLWLLQSRHFMAPLNISLIQEDRLLALPHLNWAFRNSEIPRFVSLETGPGKGWIYMQNQKDIQVQEFHCPL